MAHTYTWQLNRGELIFRSLLNMARCFIATQLRETARLLIKAQFVRAYYGSTGTVQSYTTASAGKPESMM